MTVTGSPDGGSLALEAAITESGFELANARNLG